MAYVGNDMCADRSDATKWITEYIDELKSPRSDSVKLQADLGIRGSHMAKRILSHITHHFKRKVSIILSADPTKIDLMTYATAQSDQVFVIR